MTKNFLQLKFVCVYISLFVYASGSAQTDSTKILSLDSIEIHAYAAKTLLNHTASLNYVSAADMNRYAGVNMLPALNASPGVRMEERSPGSYRLNIRGSSVRSPYGVRNVKIYYNNIPFTAPGGASMLNMLGLTQVGSVEIIKGPAGSMYGAGTGGVLLMQSQNTSDMHSVGFKAGADGLLGLNVALNLKNQRIQFEHLQYDGYRNHTEMKRNSATWIGNWKTGVHSHTQAMMLYTDLFYETPGALTLAEFQTNPRGARPASPVFPGAENARASIRQESLLAGVTHNSKLSSSWNNISSIYALFNRTQNPTVQNYERKREPHFGARSVFDYNFRVGQSFFTIHSGIELQQGIFNYRTYTNDAGRADSLFEVEDLILRQGMVFAQMDLSFKKWQFNVGGSYSGVQMDMERTKGQLLGDAEKKLNAFAPRIAIGYKPIKSMAVYLNMSDGFSPPAADEIFADNHTHNLELKAERSRNFEAGTRGNLAGGNLDFDLSYFISNIKSGIVTRRDAGGGNYFVNAGKLEQKGFEAQLGYWVIQKPNHFLTALKLRTAYANYHFIYKEFEQSGNDYSGNDMPGVAPQNFSLLADVYLKQALVVYLTYAYTDPIALNDANAAYADSYNLLSMKIDYKKTFSKWQMNLFTGVDNLTDQRYSLGNDVNGFGGRFYNLAPGRSFYAGFKLGLNRN